MDKINRIIEWTKLKIRIEVKNEEREVYFHEGEVWWVNLGVNIGFEQDGKNKKHERPVLVLKKVNSKLLWVLPLSTKKKGNIYYYNFEADKDSNIRSGSVILSQIRTISDKRLLRKIGIINKSDFENIKERIKELLKNQSICERWIDYRSFPSQGRSRSPKAICTCSIYNTVS